MNREQKTIEVGKLKDKFSKAGLILVTDYKGLKVNNFNELRGKLREKDSEIKVIKNRLARRALEGTPLENLSEHFTGTTAITTTTGDPAAPAKVLVEFAKKNKQVKFRAGVMKGEPLSIEEVEALAKLPSREELIAKLMGSMMAPARNFVSVLAQIPRQLVNVLSAIRDKKEGEG